MDSLIIRGKINKNLLIIKKNAQISLLFSTFVLEITNSQPQKQEKPSTHPSIMAK